MMHPRGSSILIQQLISCDPLSPSSISILYLPLSPLERASSLDPNGLDRIEP